MGIVFRVIPFGVKTIEQLHLPKVVERDRQEQSRADPGDREPPAPASRRRLAAMIEQINSDRIMTIEDPIEFLIRDRRSIVNQREIGVDTQSFANACVRLCVRTPT